MSGSTIVRTNLMTFSGVSRGEGEDKGILCKKYIYGVPDRLVQ